MILHLCRPCVAPNAALPVTRLRGYVNVLAAADAAAERAVSAFG